ncbi:MAG: diguanylate cyclase, partial [Bacillota bacterium]
PLTNVWNRRYFDKALVQEWQQALQKERSLSLMFIDIDDFKVYNDYYGHRAGDECLQKVATTIKKATDYKGSIVARYGGEEFVVLLPDINIDHPAARIARTVRQKVADLNIPQAVNSNWEWVTISLGLASLIPNDKFLPEDLVLAADKAMYSAKEDGKNQIKINPVKIQATN